MKRANYSIYSLKAGETSMQRKSLEYDTLYLVQNVLPFHIIEVLNLKQVLKT